MASVNKVILIGNLGRDPEVRYMPDGAAVANFSIATTRTWKDKQSGERQEETEWHRISVYGRMAETAGEYLSKGKAVYIEGRLKTRKWQDRDGGDRYTTEVIAESMQFLSPRGEGGGQQSAGTQRSGEYEPPAQQRTHGQQRQARTEGITQQPAAARRPASGFDDIDDDIPF